jgi:hypothetical protein
VIVETCAEAFGVSVPAGGDVLREGRSLRLQELHDVAIARHHFDAALCLVTPAHTAALALGPRSFCWLVDGFAPQQWVDALSTSVEQLESTLILTTQEAPGRRAQ